MHNLVVCSIETKEAGMKSQTPGRENLESFESPEDIDLPPHTGRTTSMFITLSGVNAGEIWFDYPLHISMP
jgi:hypothetical protein